METRLGPYVPPEPGQVMESPGSQEASGKAGSSLVKSIPPPLKRASAQFCPAPVPAMPSQLVPAWIEFQDCRRLQLERKRRLERERARFRQMEENLRRWQKSVRRQLTQNVVEWIRRDFAWIRNAMNLARKTVARFFRETVDELRRRVWEQCANLENPKVPRTFTEWLRGQDREDLAEAWRHRCPSCKGAMSQKASVEDDGPRPF